MKKRFISVMIMALAVVSILSGCQKKVTTVADDITAQNSEYVTMEEFKLKEEPSVTGESIGCCAILIPDTFVRSEDVEGMYVSRLYPLDASNIYYSVVEPEDIGAINDSLTKEDYKEAVERSYAALGHPVELNVDAFDVDSIEDIPCFKIRSHYNVGERDVQQLVYIIVADKIHVITYTQLSDDELMSDFLVDEGNIKLVREISQA